MYNTHIVRKTDDLGRIVIPRKIKQAMGITPDILVEFFIDETNNMIGIRPVIQSKDITEQE